MTKMMDIPPVWLLLAIIVAWGQGRGLPLGLSVDSALTQALASVLIWAGVVLVGAAAVSFWRARTSIIPHRTPDALITSGVFRFSRNPIYLADALILTGFVLRFDAVLSLLLVPLFVWWIDRHFIRAEEARLRASFGDAFAAYERKVRRWV